MVLGDGVCHLCQKHGFPHFWRRNDHTSLTFANGGNKVDDASRQLLRTCFQPQFFLRINGGQFLKIRSSGCHVRAVAIDGLYKNQGTEFLPFSSRTENTFDSVPCFQPKTANLGGRNINIPCSGQEIFRSQKAKTICHDFQNPFTLLLIFPLGAFVVFRLRHFFLWHLCRFFRKTTNSHIFGIFRQRL